MCTQFQPMISHVCSFSISYWLNQTVCLVSLSCGTKTSKFVENTTIKVSPEPSDFLANIVSAGIIISTGFSDISLLRDLNKNKDDNVHK